MRGVEEERHGGFGVGRGVEVEGRHADIRHSEVERTRIGFRHDEAEMAAVDGEGLKERLELFGGRRHRRIV
jgi:hypothetical protein